MLPSAIYFIAYCPLLTLSLPTGWERKQQITRLHGNNSSGQTPTALAHCPLFKLKAYRRFQPVGSGQNSPYSYGVMLSFTHQGWKHQHLKRPPKTTSKKKGNHNE